VVRDGIDVELPRLGRTRIGLRGRHQAANVAVADAVLDALASARIAEVPVAARRAGYATARWPGRLELLEVNGRDVLLDGAHNPAGGAALAAALDDLRPFLAPGPVTLVTASMADKDVDGIIRSFLRSTSLADARIVATNVDLPRALPAADLAGRWRAAATGLEIEVVTEPEAALDRAVNNGDGPVVVAGSLYLVGVARRRFVDDPLLRDPDDRPR
jgi:folylpolyglutamate synthase/dihydropteroate synthase